VERLPGVRSAATVKPLPLNFEASERGFRIAGRQPASPEERLHAREHLVSGGYFDTVRLPLLAGRVFRDGGGGALEVVINRTFAERWWPGASPLGTTLELDGFGDEPAAATVVGVVADSKNFQVDEKPTAILYLPQSAATPRRNFLAVHVEGEPLSAAAGVRGVIAAVGRGVPVTQVRTMEQVVGDSLKPYDISTKVLAALAVLALLLAGIGLYGIVAHGVRQRVREIGIRMALGADRRDIAATAVRQGVRLAAVGLALGLLLAVVLSRLLSSVLFGVGALDPLALGATVVLLAATLVAAVLVPTRRAARLDPVSALRTE
jgi:predicted permease